MIGLESCFGALNTALNQKVALDKIIETLTINPRKILNIEPTSFKEGVEANLTLFNPSQKEVFSESKIMSLNKNSGFIGKELLGTVVAVINKNQIV